MIFNMSLAISVYLLNEVNFCIFPICIVCSCNMLSYIVILTDAAWVIELAARVSVVMIFLPVISIRVLVMMKVSVAPLFFLFGELPLLLNYLRDRQVWQIREILCQIILTMWSCGCLISLIVFLVLYLI